MNGISPISTPAPAGPPHPPVADAAPEDEFSGELSQLERRQADLDALRDAVGAGALTLRSEVTIGGATMTLAAYLSEHDLLSVVRRSSGGPLLARDHTVDLDAASEQLTARRAAVIALREEAAEVPLPTAVVRGAELMSVSPEGFVELLRTNIDDIDDRVLSARTRIEQALSASRDIGQRLRVLQAMHQVAVRDGRTGALGDATITLDERPMTMAAAVSAYDLAANLGLDGADDFSSRSLSPESLQSAIDGLREKQTQVTSQNELDMIALQQAMQDRGRRIQLVSRILSMFSETRQAIVGNFR